jgi:hypothetical protein
MVTLSAMRTSLTELHVISLLGGDGDPVRHAYQPHWVTCYFPARRWWWPCPPCEPASQSYMLFPCQEVMVTLSAMRTSHAYQMFYVNVFRSAFRIFSFVSLCPKSIQYSLHTYLVCSISERKFTATFAQWWSSTYIYIYIMFKHFMLCCIHAVYISYSDTCT